MTVGTVGATMTALVKAERAPGLWLQEVPVPVAGEG